MAVVGTSAQGILERSVVSSFGMKAANSVVSVRGTIGQPVAGLSRGTVEAGIGFWHRAYSETSPVPVVIVSVIDDTIAIGETAAIRLNVDRAFGLQDDSAYVINGELRCGSSVLFPADEMAARSYDGADVVVETGFEIRSKMTTLSGPSLTAKLGDLEYSMVELEDVKIKGLENAVLIVKPGTITIGGICKEGDGPRLIKESKPASIRVVSRLPATDHVAIAITMLERGLHKILIHDVSGKLIYASEFASDAHDLVMTVPLLNEPSGVLVASLITPTQVLHSSFAVRR